MLGWSVMRCVSSRFSQEIIALYFLAITAFINACSSEKPNSQVIFGISSMDGMRAPRYVMAAGDHKRSYIFLVFDDM